MQQIPHTNHSQKKRFARHAQGLHLVLFAGLLLLSACGGDPYTDLNAFVEQVKAQPKGHIPPMPEVKIFETFAYDADGLRNPFSPSIKENLAQAHGFGLQPDANRKREPLEEYPLDSLTFVGHLKKSGEEWGLIIAPDNTIYRIQIGNYLGKNYGKIVSIDETSIKLVEIIATGTGGWIDREATLVLSE